MKIYFKIILLLLALLNICFSQNQALAPKTIMNNPYPSIWRNITVIENKKITGSGDYVFMIFSRF